MATGATTEYNIPYPIPSDPVDVASDIRALAERVAILFASVPEEEVQVATNALFQIVPLDDMSRHFDGIEDTFTPRYDNEKVVVTNPYRVIATINGLIQTPNFEDYVSLAPSIDTSGFVLTTEGDFRFLDIPQPGDRFDARIMPGALINEKERKYPLVPINLVMGD
jgi:hypothetical protein